MGRPIRINPSRAGAALGLVLVALVALVLLGLFLLSSGRPSPAPVAGGPAVGDGEVAGATARAPIATPTLQPESAPAPTTARAPVAAPDTDDRGDPSELEARVAWDRLLASFYGATEPDLDALHSIPRLLGNLATVSPGTLSEAEAPGYWGARLQFGDLGLEGYALIGGNDLRLTIVEAFGGRDYDRRRVTLTTTLADGRADAGAIAVHHQVDRSDPELVDSLLDEPGVVGWELSVDREHGGVARPLLVLAIEDDEGDPVVVDGQPEDPGFRDHDAPSSEADPDAFDLDPWRTWSALHADLRARADERD